jgi:hypothetical protein
MAKAFGRLRGAVRQWPFWGVLLCGLANSILWVRGDAVLPSNLAVIVALLVVAGVAGVVTPEKPMYTTWVLVLGTPSPLGHVPFAIGLLPLAAFGLPLSVGSVEDVFVGLAGLFVMFGYGLAFAFAPYWLLVHAGWVLRGRLHHLARRAGRPIHEQRSPSRRWCLAKRFATALFV